VLKILTSIYVLYLLLFATGIAAPVFHLIIALMILVLPGACLMSRLGVKQWTARYYLYVISSSMALALVCKLALNLLGIGITPFSFSASLFLLSGALAYKRKLGQVPMLYAAAFVICFLAIDMISIDTGLIYDSDRFMFGTYELMYHNRPGAGYYEDSHSLEHDKSSSLLGGIYTPYLIYDYGHPPGIKLASAYSATLGGYLEYSRVFSDSSPVLDGSSDDLERLQANYNFRHIEPDQHYLALNRIPIVFFLACLLMLIFIFARSTGGTVSGIFSIVFFLIFAAKEPTMWFDASEAAYIFLCIFGLYIHVAGEGMLPKLVIGITGGLVHQRFLFIAAASLVFALVKRKVSEAITFLGFFSGISLYIIYGLLRDASVFISSFFILHLYDRVIGDFVDDGSVMVNILGQWSTLIRQLSPAFFALLAILSILYIILSRDWQLPVFFACSAFIGSIIWPYAPRYLSASVVVMCLMAASALGLGIRLWRHHGIH